MPNSLFRPAVKPPPVFSPSTALHPLASPPLIYVHPPDMLTCEIAVLSKQVCEVHEPDVLNIACLVHLTRTAFRDYGNRACLDLDPMLELQREYLRAYIAFKNIRMPAVMSAIAALERAESTIGYLDSLLD